jgi:hypothetical protein
LCKNNMRQSLYCVRDKHGKKTIDHQFLAFLPFLLFAAVQYPKIQEEGKQKLWVCLTCFCGNICMWVKTSELRSAEMRSK